MEAPKLDFVGESILANQKASETARSVVATLIDLIDKETDPDKKQALDKAARELLDLARSANSAVSAAVSRTLKGG
ncbi:MAG: hypothetical protein OHK0024_09790 [Thalassobaculales bacterium]